MSHHGPVLVGGTQGICRIRELIPELARLPCPVLLEGETGTGKGLLARAIHNAFPVGPFVTIDSASLPVPLAESELFGFVKGAFTGACTSKRGLIEQADGGTVFFDEIAELPLEVQPKLLRVLEDGEFRPLGSTTCRRISFRVLAATNRDLATEVKQCRFRRDLYYRLNAVIIRLPPLRERREDIPLLVEHFLPGTRHLWEISADAWKVLLAYSWPGNVRELKNWVQCMVTESCSLPGADTLRLRSTLSGQTGPYDSGPFQAPSDPTTGAPQQTPTGFPPFLPLAELERRAVMEALRCTAGRRRPAATMLGIGRTTLYRRLKHYEHHTPNDIRSVTGPRTPAPPPDSEVRA